MSPPTAQPNSREALLAEIAAFRPGPRGARLTQLCRRLREALRVERVWLRLADGGEFAWPNTTSARGTRYRWIPLLAGDQRVGELGVAHGFLPLGRRRERLLTDCGHLLGPVLSGLRAQSELDGSLQAARGHAERVAALRRRASGERNAERQQIERDLHDGAQHHLVALGMTVGLLELHAQNQDRAGVTGQLRRLREGLDRAEDSLLTVASGGSPLLAEAGVLPALTAEFRDTGVQVRLQVDGWDATRRYEAVVEMAIYFICLEAVNNAHKHAPGAEVELWLSDSPSGLRFSVTDNGPGMSPEVRERLSGLSNMRRRIVVAGGRIQVRTGVGAGTAVHGFIPF